MCDMPIPFGAEFNASAPGPLEQQSRDNQGPKPSQIEPIRSTYVPRYTSTNTAYAPIYHRPRKSPQTSESLQTFSYYPSAPAAPSTPQQEYYFTGPASNSQSMYQMYGQEPSTNYHPSQPMPSYQYQPVQLNPPAAQYSGFQNPGIIDPRTANSPFDVRRNFHGSCEKCGSFCSSNGFNQNFMAMANSEPQRYAQVGANSEMTSINRPYRFYNPSNPANRKHRDHILF